MTASIQADLQRAIDQLEYISKPPSIPLPAALQVEAMRCQIGEVRDKLLAIQQALENQDVARELGSAS